MSYSRIEIGDYVKHKDKSINGGFDMSVEDILMVQGIITKLKCTYFAAPDGQMKTVWFKIEDIELNHLKGV